MKHKYLIASLALLPMFAFAHPQGHADSLLLGFSHPWVGMDHLLAMLAVGMLAAAQADLKTKVILMLCFLLSLIAGVYAPVPVNLLTSVEYIVALSVGLLGLSLLITPRLPSAICNFVVIASGLLHGIVHGAEIPNNSQSDSFVVGMLLASIVLHLGGFIWFSWGVKRALPYFRFACAACLSVSSAILMLHI